MGKLRKFSLAGLLLVTFAIAATWCAAQYFDVVYAGDSVHIQLLRNGVLCGSTHFVSLDGVRGPELYYVGLSERLTIRIQRQNFGLTPNLSVGFYLPYWLMIFAATLSVWLIWIRRTRPFNPPLCGQCKYNLTGNTTGVCPECGAAIGATGLR